MNLSQFELDEVLALGYESVREHPLFPRLRALVLSADPVFLARIDEIVAGFLEDAREPREPDGDDLAIAYEAWLNYEMEMMI